jgi:hypothetical protein
VVAGLRGGRLGVGERQAASVAAWPTPLGTLTHQVRSEDCERQAASVEAGSAVWAEAIPENVSSAAQAARTPTLSSPRDQSRQPQQQDRSDLFSANAQLA